MTDISTRTAGKSFRKGLSLPRPGSSSAGGRMASPARTAERSHMTKATNDRYLIGDFDVLLCNVSNSIFRGKARDGGLSLMPDRNAIDWLKDYHGVETDAELRRCTCDDWRVCLPAGIADEKGVIPRTPRVPTVDDPNWFGLDGSVSL